MIAQFNIAMARETEDKALDEATVRAGALGVIEDASRGFYLIAQGSDSVVGALLVTREWSDWRGCWSSPPPCGGNQPCVLGNR